MKSLENETELVAPEKRPRVVVQIVYRFFFKANFPGIRGFEAGDDVQERGLADARFAEDGDVFAGGDAQVHCLEHHPRPEALADAGNMQDQRGLPLVS